MSTERAAAEARLRAMAAQLGSVNERMVFIGAAVLPLLVEDDDRWESPRSTDDVDAIAATASYTQRGRLEELLRERGFAPDMTAPHAGRFRAPDATIFDLSFAGDHVGGSGSSVDGLAVKSAQLLEGEPPLRHLSAAGFLLMKCAAFRDRGLRAPHASKDLADVAVLLLGCRSLAGQLRSNAESSEAWAQEIVSAVTTLRAAPDLLGALRTHCAQRGPLPPNTSTSLAREVMEAVEKFAW